MTALHALRLAAAEQPDGDLKRLLTWAEMHIGDQYERICEPPGSTGSNTELTGPDQRKNGGEG